MLYKPKYCCQCGEEIERIDWKLWSSRRFCQFCETEVGHYDWMPRIVLGLGIILSVFSLGNYFRTPDTNFDVHPRQISSQPRIDRNFADKPAKSGAETNERNFYKNSDTTSNVESPTKQIDVETKNAATSESSVRHYETPQNKIDEPVYFCGAQTKKGTPCSRRVKGGGRCWQHKDKEAMLPEKELLANH
jgi:hypothetical protein